MYGNFSFLQTSMPEIHKSFVVRQLQSMPLEMLVEEGSVSGRKLNFLVSEGDRVASDYVVCPDQASAQRTKAIRSSGTVETRAVIFLAEDTFVKVAYGSNIYTIYTRPTPEEVAKYGTPQRGRR